MRRMLVLAAVLFLVPYMMSASRLVYPQQTPAGGIQIEDAKLGKKIKDKQIASETSEFALNDKVYLWLKTTGGAGKSLIVTWKNGDHAYKRNMAIGGSPWRSWGYKIAALPGNWTVSIADAKGTVLKELSFKVGS
jgi:hypothetical protein